MRAGEQVIRPGTGNFPKANSLLPSLIRTLLNGPEGLGSSLALPRSAGGRARPITAELLSAHACRTVLAGDELALGLGGGSCCEGRGNGDDDEGEEFHFGDSGGWYNTVSVKTS